MEPLISVIVPVYNVRDYLKRCIESLLAQTYKNLDIILVDDGSTDQSDKICDQYANQYTFIRSFHKKNGGLSDARNYGMTEVEGEYITFLDSDDWISPYCISNLYFAIRETGADMSTDCFENVFENKGVTSRTSSKLLHLQNMRSEEYLEKMLYQDHAETTAWGKLYKRKIIDGLEYPKGKLYEDIPVTYQVIKRCHSIAVIENVDWYYFQRKSSIQNMNFNEHKLDGIKHCHDLMMNVKKDFPELGVAAECRYISTTCNILFQIPDEPRYKDLRKKMWNEIRKYRKDVLADKKARRKAKIACLLSYFGYSILEIVYRRTQWRG